MGSGNGINALQNSDMGELGKIVERGFARPEIDAVEIETIRGDVRRLMRIVRRRLTGSTWELCKSRLPTFTLRAVSQGIP